MSESERLRVFRKMIYRRVKDAIFTPLDKREMGRGTAVNRGWDIMMMY